jgi:hypothetical protein
MASTDARPVPKRAVAYRVVFPILDADGDLVTGATGLDSEISVDQGTFVDCTNEATEIATASGMYYLDLTSAEMTGDCISVIIKTTSSGAKTTPIVLYPEEAGDIRVDATMISGDATAADNLEAAADGTGFNLGGGSVVAASVTGAVGSVAADGITASSIATDALGALELAAGAASEIATAVRTELAVELARIDAAITTRLASAGYTAPDNSTVSSISALLTTVATYVDTEVAAILAAVDTEVGAIKAVTDALPNAGALTTIQADLDDIQTRLPAALVSGRVDASVGAMAADVVTASALAADAVDEILDDTIGDGTITVRQALRVLIAGMAGKLSGAATSTITIRNTADSANVIVATVDADGNRSAVTVTP